MNADEVLAQLDGDTRAYLQILLSAGGTAFDDHATGASTRFHQTAEQDLRETLQALRADGPLRRRASPAS